MLQRWKRRAQRSPQPPPLCAGGLPTRRADPGVVFAVGPVAMDFEVELRADAKAKAGFRLWAVGSAGAEAGVSRGRTHRVSFTLTPKTANGTDLLMRATRPRQPGPGATTERIKEY
ncbi:trypco2 family protein [Streptomyces sp. NPDC046876]|uniref:trypco2 family protein n=1 Tax=Streptomyces sp. NPDC046876 TaxID=3155616 RepID=UPI0033F6EA27